MRRLALKAVAQIFFKLIDLSSKEKSFIESPFPP